VYNALRIGEQNLQHVFLEKRQAQGTQHLFGLLHAIKNRVRISFEYQKYYRDHVSKRTVAPLALKEFKNRWYLFARDYHDGRVKTYALDRMANLEFLKTKFPKIDFDLSQMLKHCFGIIVPSDEKPQKIILSFNQFQGKYIKSLPLHETQEILIDNDNELRISLNIYPTHDFKMEILSLGENVKVLEPKNFVKEVKDSYSKALKQY
jgi:predicted DNA-binding transcriptional regulator YafY